MSDETIKICLVEDEPTIQELVSARLSREGFVIDSYDNAGEVSAKLGQRSPWDLYVLDVMLKGETSGLELCDSIRRKYSQIPILILSALSEPSDRIEGLKTGADDYLTKPFEMEELLLRIKGMLGRRSWYQQLPQNKSDYRWGNCQINFETYEARVGKQQYMLTQKECMLMKLLIENAGRVVTRDEILNRVWGYNAFPSARTVDNFILKLRKYFEEKPGQPRFIQSVRGVGYKFQVE